MTTSRIRGLKYFRLSGAISLVGAVLALVLNLVAEAQNQTLFSDDFEDGNANGWTKSGGSWAVVSDGSLVYRPSDPGTNEIVPGYASLPARRRGWQIHRRRARRAWNRMIATASANHSTQARRDRERPLPVN